MPAVPNVDRAHEVIESIVSLTEQRDQRSLEQSLLTTVAEMLGNAEGWLLDNLTGTGEDAACTLLHGEAATLPQWIIDQGRAQPASDPFNLVEHDGRIYLLARLADTGIGRVHLLVLAQPSWPDAELQLALGMIRVYQNFVALLSDSEKDTLTGLYNRRKLEMAFKAIAAQPAWGRRQKDQRNGDYLAILDLDRFKRINDGYGHLVGDEVLLVFANILRRTLRDSDQIFRHGGEEFVALLRETPNDSIEDVLERIRRNVEQHAFTQVGTVTVSIGFARLDGCASPVDVMSKADRALGYAKDHGRNQVREFESLVNQHLLE
ncbi:MAG: GGDEF domain-containing protein [Gallionellaceae bacterium]|nr:GGDEF domain-containing protein [Gallionellaceae bacterium]